jgi:histone-lysine N-methyltransferase SETMAR
MLEGFFDCQGTLHYEFIPKGKTVNRDMYINILHHLGDVVRRKCPQKMESQSCCLFHNDAPAHQSVSVKNFLTKNNVTIMKHPPYSPNLALVDFTCSLDCSQH